MKILSIAAIVVLLFVFSFFTERPEPREELPEPTAGTPDTMNSGMTGHPPPPTFASEEEMLEYIMSWRADRMELYSETEPQGYFAVTHYYRLKNPPPETAISEIVLYSSGITLLYGTESDEFEPFVIKYNNYHSYDIETRGFWAERPFPNESYKREQDGVTYYICKADGSTGKTEVFLWVVDWYNSDGYKMTAQLPYRFTADEVLSYVSDLERVEIG